TAIGAVIRARPDSAPGPNISGSMGTFMGADISLLDSVAVTGAPVASLGGAGGDDGPVLIVYLAGGLAGTFPPDARRGAARGSTAGAGDSSYQVALLLKGGQALTAAQFENYKPSTTLGASFTITAPTGLYHPNKVLNLGSDRWSFKPEFGLAHPFGAEQKWEF